MKWLNSASTTARANLPGLASQVPVLTEPSGASNASRVPSVGTGWLSTGGGVAVSNCAAATSAGAAMCTIPMGGSVVSNTGIGDAGEKYPLRGPPPPPPAVACPRDLLHPIDRSVVHLQAKVERLAQRMDRLPRVPDRGALVAAEIIRSRFQLVKRFLHLV